MSDHYHVRVTKDHLVFIAAHFVTIGDVCERLHGHNYRVAADVTGPLDGDTFVVDFIALRDELQQITARLDHRVLLPTGHPVITVAVGESEVEVRFEDAAGFFLARNASSCRCDRRRQNLSPAGLVNGWSRA